MTNLTELSIEEKQRFVREGLVIRPQCVSPDLIETARRRIEEWYDASFDPAAIEKYTQKTFAPDLGAHPDLLNIYYASGLDSLASAFVSPDNIQPVTTVQTQIRVPDKLLRSIQPAKSMHVDGVAVPHLDPKELRTFTLLIGVLLSAVQDVDGGALRYVPGGHLGMAEWFRSGWMPGTPDQVPARIDAVPGLPFVGNPGDVIVMHHLVPHAVGSNKTDNPRLMLYFRVKHERHDEHPLEALRDPWLEFPALRSLAAEVRTSGNPNGSEVPDGGGDDS